MPTIVELLSETDKDKIEKSQLFREKAKLSFFEQTLFNNFMKNYDKTKNIVSISDFMQEFFRAFKFEKGKGMLAKLAEYGEFYQLDSEGNRKGVNQELIDQAMNQTISLKKFANSASFLEQHLSENQLGKQMIPVIIQKFIEKIDTAFGQHTGEIHPSKKERWKEIKQYYADGKIQKSLSELLADTNALFDTYRANTTDDEPSPVLWEKIYPTISISTKEIIDELHKK
jgi:hypothetical protein